MRALTVVGLLAGCGRIGFDSTDDASARDSAQADADPSAVLAGCELRLAMDESSWASGLVDSCGGDDPGMPLNNAAPVDDPERGRVGAFTGGADCVLVQDAPRLRGGAAITISAWVRPTQLSIGSFGVVSKRTNYAVDSAYSVFVWQSSSGTGSVNHLYVDVDSETERFELTSDELLDSWRQVTVVFDGSRPMAERIAVYVDGVFRTYAPEASAAIPTPAMPPAVYVGCLPLGGPAQGFVGRLDEVTIWARPLPATEVTAWYTATK